MNEPRRLLDDPNLDPAMRELLEAGAPPPPMPAAARAVLAAAAASIGQSALASALPLTVKIAVVVGLSVAGVIAGVAIVAQPSPERHGAPAPAMEAPAKPMEAPAESTEAQAESTEAAPIGAHTVELEGAPVAAPEPTPRARVSERARAEPSPPQESSSTLLEEAALLEQSRAALGARPAEALRLAELHRHRFRTGQLRAERELIAVRALLALGRRDRARRRADALVRSNPHGFYVTTVAELFDER